MKKTCNYCRAYEPGLGAGKVGNCILRRGQEKLTNEELDKYNVWPYGLGDITKWREWDIDWGSIDLIMGGSPCQGFSFAGKQLNFDDPRSKLFFEFVDILSHTKSFNNDVVFFA